MIHCIKPGFPFLWFCPKEIIAHVDKDACKRMLRKILFYWISQFRDLFFKIKMHPYNRKWMQPLKWTQDLYLFKKKKPALTNLLSRVDVLSCWVVSSSLWSLGLVAHQAPLPMGLSRQEYWSGLPLPYRLR